MTGVAVIGCVVAGAAPAGEPRGAGDLSLTRVAGDATGASAETRPVDGGDAAARDAYRLDVYWENDGTLLKPNNTQDRHYTNGNAVTLSHQPRWAERLAEWAEPIALDGDFNHTQSAAGYVLGHQMFTPQKITVERLIPDDRPYAGYLYGGVFWQRSTSDYPETRSATFDHVELNVGVVGPVALGEELQNFIHDVTNDRDPEGWDNQLDNEPTAQVFLRRKYRVPVHGLWTDARNPPFGAELLPQAELALGTVHRYVQGEMMLRVGVNLPDDFGPGEIHDVRSATGLSSPSPGGWGAYWFASAAGRVVEHNLFLEGNTFEDSHSVDEETLFGRVRTGVALQYRGEAWDVEAAWSQSFLSEEFEQQDGGDAFGQLRLAITKRF